MIYHNDRARLDAIAAAVWSDDPRFATALRTGRPRAPREYRVRRRWALAAIVALFMIGWAAGLLPPMLVLAVPFSVVWYALARHLSWPDRPRRRLRH